MIRKIFGALCIGFLLWGINYSVQAQVKVSIPDTTITIGDTVLIPIEISRVALEDSVYSYQFRISFNNQVIQVLNLEVTETLSAQWMGAPLINIGENGVVDVGHFSVKELTGAGVLIYLKIKGIGQHLESTDITFENFYFNAGNPQTISQNGRVTLNEKLISLFFDANLFSPVYIYVDKIKKNLPFDTTWFAGTIHSIATDSVQLFTSDTRFLFRRWSDDGSISHFVAPNSDTTFQCIFGTEYFLDVKTEVGTAIGQGWYESGATALISVDSLVVSGDTTRYRFLIWEGTGSDSYSGPVRNPQIIVNSPIVQNAIWEKQHFVRIQSDFGNPTGQGWHSAGDTVFIEVDSSVSIVPGTRQYFYSWEGVGDGSYSGQARRAQVFVNSPIVQTVIWEKQHFLSVHSLPESLVEFSSSGWYQARDTLAPLLAEEFVAIEKFKYRFQWWELDHNIVHENPVTIIMDTAHVLIGVYAIDSVLVAINSNPALNLPIYIDNKLSYTPYQNFWHYQSEYQIAVDSIYVESDSTTRYLFDSWGNGGERIQYLVADTSLALEVNFNRQFYLNLCTEPPGIYNFEVSGWYDQDSTVETLTAPEQIVLDADTMRFVSWTVNGVSMFENPINLVMDQPYLVVANYELLYYINGFVRDRRGRAAEGVVLILSGTRSDTIRYPADGFYHFGSLEQGAYRVTPHADWAKFEPTFRDYPVLGDVYREQNFTAIDIIPPHVNLKTPNGGEIFQPLSVDTIAWTAGDNIGVDSILVDFSDDNGQNWQSVAVLANVADSVYHWLTPDLESEDCLIRIIVVDLDGNLSWDVSDSVFAIKKCSGIVQQDLNIKPDKYQLLQNYPNPFNNITTISFELPTPDYITLMIFNEMGQEVRMLLDEQMPSGSYRIEWKGIDNYNVKVTSGLYFYRLQSQRHGVQIKKMVYLR